MANPVLSLFDFLAGTTTGTLKVRLYQTYNAVNQIPQLAEFVEAEYTGYAPQMVSKPRPEEQDDGSLLLNLNNVTFAVQLGEEVSCSVGGAYATLLVGGQECVVGVVDFGTQIPMEKPGDYCQFAFGISAGVDTLPS